MGHWGVRSHENDDADDALDAGFDRVHGAVYEDLMDDRNPASVDQIHKTLANSGTLAAAEAWLREEFGQDVEGWDEGARLAFAGVIVRHAEMGVALPDESRHRAIAWLEGEAIDWDEATTRRLRKESEIALLQRAPSAPSPRSNREDEAPGQAT